MGNKLWLSQFGNDYHERNEVRDDLVNKRCIYFTNILNIIKNDSSSQEFPKEILEVGAGKGQNMMALERINAQAGLGIKLYCTEPNEVARVELHKNAPTAELHATLDMLPTTLPYDSHSKELVFTSGVLIHVPTAELIPSMRELYRVSSRYILAMEYFSPSERKLPYHNQDDALWLRDYGATYLDNFKLKLLGFGFCWKRITQLDDITWWLFEKVN